MVVLNCTIPKEAWLRELEQRNGAVGRASASIAPASPWAKWVEKIRGFEQLGDDWDGFGAFAPSHELVESAISLASLLAERGVQPPQAVVVAPDGSICIEWHDGQGGYAEMEIDRPFHAEVMFIEPGQPARFLTLPTE